MVRHCVLCETCLQKLIRSAKGDHVSCPMCHQRFEIRELQKALQQGCLRFPLHVSPTESCGELTDYNNDEETTVPHKRRCLSNLRHAPLIVLSPDSIKEHKDEYYEKLQQLMLVHGTGSEWRTYLSSIQKATRVFNVETVRQTWNLQYRGSDPFPTNMDEIAVGYLFQVENKHPHMRQWRNLMLQQVPNFQTMLFALEHRSKMMQAVVELIGILRQSHNDDATLLSMTRDEIENKPWLGGSMVRPMKLITKVLVYAKMFQRNDLQEDISPQVFEFVHGLLEKMRINRSLQSDGYMTDEEEQLLCCEFMWYLFGCTMFTYLFRLVDMQHDRN